MTIDTGKIERPIGRILVLGGYGHFGARICRALAEDGRAEVVIAGRRRPRAEALAKQLREACPGAAVRAAELDWREPRFVRRLGTIAPTIVIHTAGPFQRQDYTVAEASIACRSHYLDLADSRHFVAGFDELDKPARRRNLRLVTGASTLPGVSSMVVRHLARDLAAIERVEVAILSANQSPRGKATVAGVLSYCGSPFQTLRNGRWVASHGWQDLRKLRFGAAGRWVGACDVPDLELFPRHYAGVGSVTFHAGLELAWQQWALWGMAGLTRAGIVRDWARYAGLFALASRLTRRLGSATGGMEVRIAGRGQSGAPIARTWRLTAGSNHGPHIPCVPAIVLAKRWIAGDFGPRGAKPCLSMIGLDDFAAEVAALDVSWSFTEEEGGSKDVEAFAR